MPTNLDLCARHIDLARFLADIALANRMLWIIAAAAAGIVAGVLLSWSL